MCWEDGINLINKAQEKVTEQFEWQLYCSILPHSSEKDLTFDKFRNKKKTINNKKENLSIEEILEKAEELRKVHQGKHLGVVKS